MMETIPIINSHGATASRFRGSLFLGMLVLLTFVHLAKIGDQAISMRSYFTPAYTKRHRPSSLYFCLDALYANGRWEGNTWKVNDQERCRLEDFTKDEFCRVLGSRNILIIGDSINLQLFEALKYLLEAKDQKHMRFVRMGRNPNPVLSGATICGSSRLTFIRNDRLILDADMGEKEYINSTSLQLSSFETLAPFHEIFILNAGAHYSSTNTYAQDTEKLRRALEPYRSKHTILFRTTPRGHVRCSITDSIIPSTNSTTWQSFFPTSGEHPDPLYSKYHYALFPQYNEILRTEMKGVGTVLEGALQVELRPDGHKKPPTDCLHYTARHPAHLEWCRLVLNAVKGQLS